ncbi:MAG: S1/P1 nuclease, partial [Armatimonadota bacterium]|nr:S1/P1 nuclease [Armatimonadota bacterium]
AWGWGPTGHMVVAKIAERELTPAAKTEARRLLRIRRLAIPSIPGIPISGVTPDQIRPTASNSDFVSAACWPDDIKSNTRAFNSWHFIDVPFSPDSTPLPAEDPVNAKVIMAQCVSTLRSPTASDNLKATMLRFLIHLVGDVHQPLHCSARVTAAHPQGDRGGNDFKINTPEGQLHGYWDGGVQLFRDPMRQQNPENRRKRRSKAAITRLANGIIAVFPRSSLPQRTDLNFDTWVNESSGLAQSVAYNLTENSTPSNTYNGTAQHVVRQRAALGGYRLAALLNGIFR